MKWAAPFDPTTESIWVAATVTGTKTTAKSLIFIFDPGTEMTILDSRVAASIGLDRSQSIGRIRFDGVAHSYKAYRVIAPQVRVFGRSMTDLEVGCSPLQRKFHADGLLGLDFLRGLRVTLDFIDGRIALTDE